MTIRCEVFWKSENLRATAQRMFERTPDVTRAEPLQDVADAEKFLIHRLQRCLENEPLEQVRFDCINIYKGYWAHLLVGRNPRLEGVGLVTDVGEGEGTLRMNERLDLDDGSNHFTIVRPAERTATVTCHVTFLTDLGQ